MTSEETAQLILLASQTYTVSVGFLILFAGIFGHLVDILVFTSSKQFRKSQAAFYLTTESIVNTIQLIISFSSRIAISGFNNDLTRTSLAWCKIRQTIAAGCTLLSFTIVCFAAMDQYFSTSYHPTLKQMSTIKLARYLTLIAVVFWSLHSIPFLILLDINPIYGCFTLNRPFTTYITYVYYLILSGLLPSMISTTFASLAFSNVRRIVRHQIPIIRRRLDKQLTAMILMRIVFLNVVMVPFIIDRIYTIQVQIDPSHIVHRAIILLIDSIVYSLFYLNFSGSFYLFLISSARFRRQVKYILLKKYWRKCFQRVMGDNRIVPRSHVSSVELD